MTGLGLSRSIDQYRYGCDKDLERAKPIYAKVLFDKYESLDEGQRSKLCDARDGKLGCPMPELRSRVVDSLVKGDREMFDKIYDEAMAKDEVEAVDSVHILRCVSSDLCEHGRRCPIPRSSILFP